MRHDTLPLGTRTTRTPRGTVPGVARKVEFDSENLIALEPLLLRLGGKRGLFERLRNRERWLIARPAAGEPDVSVELNLVVTMTGFEPGKPLLPGLAERGVSTPSGWQLMADVGWVLGWRAPRNEEPEQVLRFALRVVRELGLAPADGRWRAQLEGRPPRPGWQTEEKVSI
jgi:hypothetical protein